MSSWFWGKIWICCIFPTKSLFKISILIEILFFIFVIIKRYLCGCLLIFVLKGDFLIIFQKWEVFWKCVRLKRFRSVWRYTIPVYQCFVHFTQILTLSFCFLFIQKRASTPFLRISILYSRRKMIMVGKNCPLIVISCSLNWRWRIAIRGSKFGRRSK